MAHRTSLSPSIIEVDNSTLHETKEDLRLDQLIPADILADRDRLKAFLESYYAFMNMDEFVYQETETFTETVLDGKATFRILDPNNENDRFYTDETGANSTLILTSPTGDSPAEFTFDGTSNSIVDVGKVSSITMTNTGTGYTSATVTFSAPPVGITATGTAVIENGSITSITITNPGNGYTSAPSITITGDGIDAAAIAAISSNNKLKLSSFQQLALPVGTRVVYDAGDGTAIGGLTDDQVYYVVFSNDGNVQLSLTSGGTPITLTGVGTGTIHKIRGAAATMEIPLTDVNVSITNGNELPGSLAESTSEIGKTFTILGLSSFNNYTATLTTIVKYWVGPGPSWVMNNIEAAMDIDRNETNYLELMQKEIAAAIPRDVTVNKRNLYKRIIDFYKLRGSSDSIEIFFRLLFNDSVEVEYPYDQTLVPSSGKWDQPNEVITSTNGVVNNSTSVTIIAANDNIRLSSKLVVGTTYTLANDIRVTAINGTSITLSDPVTLTDGQEISFVPRGTYLDNKGFLSYNIKLQDSLRYQKFSYLIKTGKNLSDWEYVYDKLVHPAGFIYFAEILIFLELVDSTLTAAKNLASMPFTQPGVIGPEDIPLLVEMFASTFLPGTQAFIHKTGTLSLSLKNGVITGSTITNAGSGYTIAPITFDGSDDEVLGTGIVNITDNTIKLTTDEQATLSIGSRVTYNSGGGTAIGGLVSGTQYFIKTSTGGKISLSATSGGTVIDITSVGSGTSHTFIKEIITTTDSGTPSGFTTATLSNTFTNGSLSAITIVNGGKDYNVPTGTVAAPPRIAFDGSDDEVAGVGIVNIADDTIKLTTPQAAALPIGAKVVYDSGGNTSIGGLISGNEYYIVYNTNDEVKLSETSGGPVVDITGVGAGTDHGFTGETATITLSKTDGELQSVTIVEPGFGYTSAPAISFSGVEQSNGSGVNPSVTIAIDSDGRLDRDNITINSSGGGWSSLFATVAANPNAGSISSIKVFGKADKKYTTAPSIVFSQPTAKDADGNLLSSNVLATAAFTIASNDILYTAQEEADDLLLAEGLRVGAIEGQVKTFKGEITGVNITNAGSGYIDDPIVRLDSAAHNEQRVADQKEIMILSLNHNNVDQMVTEVKVNPRQSSGSLRGYTLYDGGRLQDGVIGVVDSVTMDNNGSGYTEATVTFSGGGARVQATGTATISSGSISGITITSGGDGYISAPTITITGDGSNAAATAVVDLDYVITQQTPVADKFLPEHKVKVINSNFRTIINNGYKQRKGNQNFFSSSRLYNTDQTIEFLGNNTLQTIDSTVINNYNTSANVHID